MGVRALGGVKDVAIATDSRVPTTAGFIAEPLDRTETMKSDVRGAGTTTERFQTEAVHHPRRCVQLAARVEVRRTVSTEGSEPHLAASSMALVEREQAIFFRREPRMVGRQVEPGRLGGGCEGRHGHCCPLRWSSLLSPVELALAGRACARWSSLRSLVELVETHHLSAGRACRDPPVLANKIAIL